MMSLIRIQYEDTPHGRRLSKDFGISHRDRATGNVLAHHYPSGKRLVWTEVDGEASIPSEYQTYDMALADWKGRVKSGRAILEKKA